MALSKLVFKPGINLDQTNYASEGGWFSMDKVRFRSGFPEKLGGWVVATTSEYAGAARSLFSWTTSDGGNPIGIGTDQKMYVTMGGILYDITPIRATFSTTATDNCFATTSGSSTVTVTIVGNGASNGDYVTFSGATAVGGIAAASLNREFSLTYVTGSVFTIELGTGVGTGSISGTTLTITAMASGEFSVGDPVTGTGVTSGTYITALGTAVGGVGTYTVSASQTVSSTTISSRATSTVASGGGTAISAAFQISVGSGAAATGYGWGTGTWGRGTWGSPSTTPVALPVRLVFQDNYSNTNNDLVFNNRDADIYYWTYDATTVARAVLLSSISGAVAVPKQVGKTMFTPQGFLLALGCTTYDPGASSPDYEGYYDPLMIRWSNVDPDIGPEPENWQITSTNTAGFLRIQSGSRIITAINTRQETLVWTDTSLNSLQYLGAPEVFGIQQLSAHVTIAGPNALIGANNLTYWMGTNKFYVYSGRVDTLPCTLRQYVFGNVNLSQSDLFFAGSNVQFNEIIFFYCSQNSTEIDRYVIYNYAEDIWYYGNLVRTAWVDASNSLYPLAVNDGWLYQHENGTDDGQPLGLPPAAMESYIQSADVDIEDGDKFMLIRRVIPDINFTGSELNDPVTGAALTPTAYVTVGVRNFPGAQQHYVDPTDSSQYLSAEGQPLEKPVASQYAATAVVNTFTNQVFIRARGRQLNFKISSNTVGTQWQLGMPRVDARPDGTRG